MNDAEIEKTFRENGLKQVYCFECDAFFGNVVSHDNTRIPKGAHPYTHVLAYTYSHYTNIIAEVALKRLKGISGTASEIYHE